MLEVVELLQAAPILQLARVQVSHDSDPGSQPWVHPGILSLWKPAAVFLQCPGKIPPSSQVIAKPKMCWEKQALSGWGLQSTHSSTGNEAVRSMSPKHYSMGPQKKLGRRSFKSLKVYRDVKLLIWFEGWFFFLSVKGNLRNLFVKQTKQK